MLVAWFTEMALAGGIHVAVASPDWDDDRLARQLSKRLGAEVELVPATDLVQPGRAIAGTPPGEQPGRLTDPELRRLRVELEAARDAGDCEAQRQIADRVAFVDRKPARELRFAALVAAGTCAERKALDGPDWRQAVESGDVLLPFAHALALSGRDPGLLERADASARGRLEAAAVGIRTLPKQSVEVTPGRPVRIDGLEVQPDVSGRIELAWGRADVQLLREQDGVLAWGPSFRVAPGVPARPEAAAAERVAGLLAELPTDGAARFGPEIGAYVGLVDADALYVAVPDRRRWALWRWDPEGGRLVPEGRD